MDRRSTQGPAQRRPGNRASLEHRVAELARRLDQRDAELAEALEQQLAMAEILRVISSSPGDAGPVFDTIVDNAARLCEANFSAVFLRDGERLYTPAHTPVTPSFAEYIERGFPVDRGTTAGRATLQRSPVQVVDILADPEFGVTPAHLSEAVRTVLAVPLLRDGKVVGVINAWRREVRPFSERQTKLLETFARQAVIALDNVVLFTELETRNRQLGDALEQLTATADILKAISAAPTDAAPVFETIVAHAARLCEASFAFVMLNRDGCLVLAARTACTPEFAEFLSQGKPLNRATATGRAALERRPVQVLDFLAGADVLVTPAHRREGIRTVLAVPMLRDDVLLGVIAIWRREVRAFSDKQIALLQTFADQAVIAIDNHRMFDEIQQKSRELALANQAKSRFLAAASHDLRQPMHALALFVDQLRSSRTSADRTALTARIEASVGNLSELLDQLLDLSKLEAGAVQATSADFPVQGLLDAIEGQFAPLARAKGIALRVRPSAAWLLSDVAIVRRILLNLVANAIRYTERGGVLVSCRPHGAKLRVAVWDTGCGIPDERRHDVFHEFVQLGVPTAGAGNQLGQGLGLGLAIVARLTELLGSTIELRSRVGRGSMFAFELPSGVPAATPEPVADPLRASWLRGTFAVVIDDDEAARSAMRGLLERWGCLTLAAADGNAALAGLAAHDRPPELIVSDYRLPMNETGLQAVARVRAAIGDEVPAIIVTADTTAEVAHAAQAAATPVLRKPVSPMKLRALLAQLLVTDRAQRAAA
jgi:signal transduction histidine kinase/CheY-like chemotaxis protein